VDDVTRDEAVCAAVRREMRQRGYDDHAADDAVFEEGVADIAKAAVDALIAAGWGDLTAERERLAAEAPVVTQYTAAGVALAAASGTDVAWICVDDVRDAFTALFADRDALRARAVLAEAALARAQSLHAHPQRGDQ
jgi:hypothetical protein